jgi:hypothetical protein
MYIFVLNIFSGELDQAVDTLAEHEDLSLPWIQKDPSTHRTYYSTITGGLIEYPFLGIK